MTFNLLLVRGRHGDVPAQVSPRELGTVEKKVVWRWAILPASPPLRSEVEQFWKKGHGEAARRAP